MDGWMVFWGLWLLAVVASFGVFEWRGIATRGRRGTLSNFFWWMLFADWDEDHRRKPRWVVWLPMFGFFLWLVIHFFTGGRA